MHDVSVVGCCSVEEEAAGDVEGLAGDVARPGRGQEDGQRGDVLGLVRAPERDGSVAPSLDRIRNKQNEQMVTPSGQDPRPRLPSGRPRMGVMLTRLDTGVQYALAAPYPAASQVDEDVYA